MVVTKETALTDIAKTARNTVKRKYSYSARVTDIWNILPILLNIGNQFELIDLRQIINGDFDSFLISVQQDYMAGKEVDFSSVIDKMLELEGSFSKSEKLLLKEPSTEELLWGMYSFICYPN